MEQALNPDKFELADIVEPDHRFAAKMFKCGKCTCIPLNPVQAPPSAECGHLFCESCAEEPWWCSVCEKVLQSAERLPLPQGNIVTNIYSDLPVHCPYSSAHSKLGNSGSFDGSVGDTETCADDQETTDEEKADEEKGEDGEGEQARHLTRPVLEEAQCGWKGTMQEMRRHLLECPFQLIKCPSGTVFRRKDTENHRQTDCSCTFETCPICDERVKVGTMEQHRAEKAGEHVPLLEEKLKALWQGGAKDLQSRIDELEVQQKRQCELNLKESQKRISLEEKMKDRESDIKASENRISKLEGTLKERESDIEASKSRISELEGTVKDMLAQLSKAESTFEWEINNPVEMKAKHPKVGDHFYSPEFFLRGLGPWKVRVYPSGDSRAPGGVAAFLLGSASAASAKVGWRLTVNGVSAEREEHLFDGTGAMSRGFRKFSGVAWPATNDKPVRIKVELR